MEILHSSLIVGFAILAKAIPEKNPKNVTDLGRTVKIFARKMRARYRFAHSGGLTRWDSQFQFLIKLGRMPECKTFYNSRSVTLYLLSECFNFHLRSTCLQMFMY